MWRTSELYLIKKHVTADEWSNLIKVISNYNGILRNWKLVIVNNKNQIRYLVKTRCSLPTTINGQSAFLMIKRKSISLPDCGVSQPFIMKEICNAIGIINYFEVKNKGKVKYIEINFRKVYENKISSNIHLYVQKHNGLKKYVLFNVFPATMLSINFDSDKRYFYKSAPKYLDISKCMHLLSSDDVASIFKINTFPYLNGDYFLKQSNFSFNKHSIVFGSSGCGKSKFISLLISNIRKNKILRDNYKVVVIDPHAALENDIGGLGKVIDFKSKVDSINLFLNKGDDVVSSTELLLELFKSLIADQYNSKLERVLRHSTYALLVDEKFSFNSLRKIILDLEYRNEIIKRLSSRLPVSVVDFFSSDFNELKTKSYSEAISPIISFIDEMEMLPVFNETDNPNTLKDTIQNNFLTLFSLDKTKIGDKVTKTIAGLVMQQLLMLMQSHSFDEHIIFIIDEVAVVENPILSRYLSEARKYNLSLVLAGQYFNQISDDLKNSIFANVVNYYIFRVSRLDAQILVDNFNMKIPLDDSKEQKVKFLTELNNRECIARVDSNGVLLPAFKASTLDFVSIPRKRKITSEVVQEVVNHKEKEFSFSANCSVNLRDILIKSSSSRKVVK